VPIGFTDGWTSASWLRGHVQTLEGKGRDYVWILFARLRSFNDAFRNDFRNRIGAVVKPEQHERFVIGGRQALDVLRTKDRALK
jgi:hypothetical protein